MEPTRGNLSHTTIPSSSSSSSSFSSPPLSSPDTKEKHPASIGSRPTEGKSFLSPSSCRRASRFHFSKLLFFVIPPLFPFLLFFAALWAAYVHHTTLPEPVAFSASPFDFSAGRVMAFLSAFTSGVRTLGSCNNELFAPLLMLRFFKEEILHIFPSDLRRTTKAPAENDPPRFSSSTASSPSSSSASSSSSSSSPSTFSSSAHPVILHSLSYSLLVDYDQPSISPADPNQYESARHELPPSHQEGALPRMYPPAILSSLSLCSLKGQEPLVSFPSSGDPSSGTPSFELPEHLSSLFSQLEIPACPEDEKELLQRTCDDSSDFFHHRHSSFSSSQEKQETPGQQTSQTSKGEGPMTSSKTSPSSDPTGSGVSAFFFSGKDSHGGDNPGTENSLYLTFRELANQAVHAYDKSQKERSGLSVHGDDIRVKDSFFQTLLERDVNQALIHPVSTIVASPLPHGAKGEGQDHRSSSSSPSSRSHHPSSTSSSSSSPSVSDLWWEGSLQLKRRCFNYERFFVTTPRIRDLLLKNRKMRDMSHYQRDYKVPRDASLVDQELHRKLVEENIRSSGERKDDRKRRERRDSITDILLDNILVVDISSTSGLSGGSFVKWRDGRHVFYTGLYNLAVRIQPFSEVLKMKKNGGESKEPYRRKRALLLSAHSDSANSSPGASDDGAMVATILEVARNAVYRHLDSSEKLITSSQHRDNEGDKKEKGDMKDDKENSTRLSWLLEVPLIVDINGAEEIGLLGAHGFASLHPMAREIAYAVNLESGGVGGKEIIVQTSGKYGERVLSEYKSAVASPSGFSLAMDVSDMGLFPGETDFRVWRDVLHLEGGIEFAWTSEGFYYHTKYDDIYHMNPGAVQRVGNVVLPLVLRLTEDLSALIKEEEEKHEEIIEEGKRQKNSSDQGVAPGHPSQQKRYHLPSTVEEERDEVKKEEERWGSLFSSFFSRFFPKTSWPQSSSFFADLVGMYLLTCRLSYFEALLGILLVLLLVQVHLEKQVLNITFSFPLLLLSLGSLVLSTLPALLVSALVSQILAVFSIPFITFHDWRLGTALFGLLGGLTFFYTWYRLLFAGLFKRFPASRHPFKADQAALHGSMAASVTVLYLLRLSGARSAVVPLFLLLCTSAGRIVALLLIQLTTPSLLSKGGSPSVFPSSTPHLSSTPHSDTFPGIAHVDRLAPEEENGTTLDGRFSPSLDQASLERRTTDDQKGEVVSERKASAGRRDKEEKDENACLLKMMDARRKASLLSFLHCLFIMVPITVLVQVSVSLASTFSAALGRSNSVWGLGDSSVTSMIVLPGLVLLLPLLFAPSLFFFLHHHHYHYQSSFDFLTTSTLERRGHPMKRNGSPASTTEHEEERGVISRRPRRLFFLPLSSWRTAVGAVVLAFLISYYCRRSPPSFSSSPKSLSSSSSDGAVELPQENAGANLLDSEKQEEDSQRGEKSFFSSMIGLDVSPLSSLQAFLEKKDLWWILERSFMPTFAERVGNSLFISSLSSIFHGYRPRASFPYSPERPLRLELRLFSRRYINGEVMREGESQGRWRIADDDMVGRNFIPSRGKKYKEDIGILIRGVSPPGRLLDPSSYTSPYVLEAIRRGVKTAMNRPSHSSTAEKREESEKTRLKAERERKEKGEKEQGEEPHEQRQSKEKRNLQKENDEESKSTVLSLKEDVMIVHFGEGSLETVRDRMMHLPQIPVAPPDSKGEALVAMIEVNSSLPTSSSSFHENKGDHSDSRREEKAERRNEDLRLEDKTSHTNHPGLALLPPHLPEQFLPDKNGNVSFPSSIFLHPTRAVFSSLYDSKTDQTRLQMRLGGSTLFSVLLPASPIAGWSLSHMTELQRIRNCDCIHLILFAPHPPAFVEFTLFLKGKSGLRFSTTSSLMDPLEPVADCGTTRNRSRNEEKDKAFSSLFEALSAGSPFSEDASSSSSPSSFSSASTTTTARDSHVSNAEMQSQVIERERKKGSREERNERKEDDKIRLRENDVQEQEGSSSHIAFWEEVENSLPDYVVGTYYSSDHIIWNIPPPPFEATFYGSAESGETI